MIIETTRVTYTYKNTSGRWVRRWLVCSKADTAKHLARLNADPNARNIKVNP